MGAEIADKKFGRIVRGKKENIEVRFFEANAALKREQWDNVFAKLEEAKSMLEELSTPPMSNVTGISNFLE